MSEFDDMNREVVAEFRSNQGVVDTAAGGYFKGKPMLILHTTGAKTGAERANPLMYLDEGDRRFVFASKGGAPDNPDSRAYFNELHKKVAAGRADLTSWFDLLDVDDYASYGGKV